MSRALCRIDWCDRLKKYAASALCEMHEQRRRKGIPLDAPVYLRGRAFARNFVKGEGCWEWTGYVARVEGYGRYGQRWAHRVSYELYVGPIPEGLQIDHLCRNRRCVNPAHLEPVTSAENTRRALPYSSLRPYGVGKCGRGHDFTDENSYRRPDGAGRQCRECIKIRTARQAAKRRKKADRFDFGGSAA